MKQLHHESYDHMVSQAFSVQAWKDDGDWMEGLHQILILWMGTASILFWLDQLCQLEFWNPLLYLSCLFFAILLHGLSVMTESGQKKLLYLGWLILSCLPLLLGMIQEGIAGLCHDADLTMSILGVLLPYRGHATDSVLAKSCAMILVSCWILLILQIAARYMRYLSILWILCMLIGSIYTGQNVDIAAYFFSLLWIMLSYIASMRAYLTILLPLTLILALLSHTLSLPQTTGWANRWEDFRYHKNSTVLPEGDLTQAGQMKRSRQVALQVDLTQEGYYYLKGYIGSIYEKNRWTNDQQSLQDMEAGILNGQTEFLRWMHSQGCSGWNELAEETDLIQRQKMKIHNLHACSKYLYLPYELLTQAGEIEEAGFGVFSSGESLLARGVLGQKEYEIKTGFSLAGSQIETLSSSEDSSGSCYDAYEEYVNRTCLTLSKEDKEILREIFDGDSTVGVDDTLLVVQRIRNWLKGHVNYDEEPGSLPEGRSFLDWFVHENPSGYDVHYATLAVMMFRYYGIPSRYVEGYLLEGGSEIPETSAHAWPEIYLSGYGWIPVEVMEEYQARMPSYLEEDGGQAYAQNQSEEQSVSDPDHSSDSTEEVSDRPEDSIEDKSAGAEDHRENVSETEENVSDRTETEENVSETGENISDSTEDISNDDQKNQDISDRKDRKQISASFILSIIIMILLLGMISGVLILWIREIFYKKRATESISPERCVIMWYQYCIWLLYELTADEKKQRRMASDNRLISWEGYWLLYHPDTRKEVLHQAGLLRQKAIYRQKGIDWQEAEPVIGYLRQEYQYLYHMLPWRKKIKVSLGIRPAAATFFKA